MTAYLLERAWVDGAVRDGVQVVVEDGRFTSVQLDVDRSATLLRGLTLPGFANTHSHAFHRALRGRSQRESGSFWTWRDQMYDVAGRLDPDLYFTLARATYAEMVAAGYTSVGEFHYLHHQPEGTPYDDPNAMGHALIAAAREVGIRITLLDTLYLSSGFGEPVKGVQRRYSDGDAHTWRARAERLRLSVAGDGSHVDALAGVVVGAAVHSVRAVPPDALGTLVHFPGPVHAHVSEQPAENEACRAAHGMTPVEVFADAGLLTGNFTAVHATHLTASDITCLGNTETTVGFCPTTERDLGDGIGPARRLLDAGARLSLGSDSHAVLDPFEEMRALELDERLASGARGRFLATELLAAGTAHGSIGFRDAGAIAVGNRADLVTIDLTTPRTAGTGGDEHSAVFAATAADVMHVVIDGRVVFDGDHASVGRDLGAAIDKVMS